MRFGTDGVRGLAFVELTEAFAQRLGRAASTVLAGSADTVVIAGDTRESTPRLVAALGRGFADAGLSIVDLGVAPTAAVAFEAARRSSIGAMVSASHNAYADNGIKLFAAGGRKLTDDLEVAIEAELERSAGAPDPIGSGASGEGVGEPASTVDWERSLVDVLEGRDLAGIRVVVDSANGAASTVAARVLSHAGADVVSINDTPNGRNINAGCGATHPSAVAAAVLEQRADIGIALDGDADRLIAVAADGTIVDGDHLIAILAGDLRSRAMLHHDTVVVTVMTNLGFHLAMADAGIDVVTTAVGDRYVLEALAEGGYSLGGEQSGHIVFADRATTGDGVLSALALIDALARSDASFAELARSSMTSLPQVLINVPIADRHTDASALIAEDVAEAERSLGAHGRVLVRASGTEPLIRVMVEAPTDELATAVAERLADVVRRRLG